MFLIRHSRKTNNPPKLILKAADPFQGLIIIIHLDINLKEMIVIIWF